MGLALCKLLMAEMTPKENSLFLTGKRSSEDQGIMSTGAWNKSDL